MGHYLTIANARFTLTGELNTDAFSESFLPFLDTDSAFDVECEIICEGADEEVASLPLMVDDPWSFRVMEGQCDVRRRNQTGETIWRVCAPLGFEKANVTWDLNLFVHHYKSYEKAWETGLGLSFLILRLRELGGLVFHGSASVLDGQGILCVGVSGKGKSTISKLLDAEGASVLTDEHPVLRMQRGSSSEFLIHGSPWPSSAGYARNECAPLKRIYFLQHGPDNEIIPLSPGDALTRLIHVAVIPWQDPALFDPCLKTVETLLANVPAAVLSFVPDESVVDVIRQDLAAERVIV